jgi:hypothetical protein
MIKNKLPKISHSIVFVFARELPQVKMFHALDDLTLALPKCKAFGEGDPREAPPLGAGSGEAGVRHVGAPMLPLPVPLNTKYLGGQPNPRRSRVVSVGELWSPN